MQSCSINWRNVPTVDSHSIKERSMHLELHRLNRDLRTARTSFSSPFVGFLRKTWERNGRKEATSPSGSTGISNHARPLGSALQRSKERSYENREGKSEKHERGEKGVRICMPSRSLTAVRIDNSRVLFLRSSSGGIGIQRGKWKRISPVPPPHRWRRARRISRPLLLLSSPACRCPPFLLP